MRDRKTIEKLKQLRQSDGFTIIEVLIVLVIAAAIMLLVFLAVPALQRNSRNTQRKQDVQALLSGVSEFASNNNGVPPANVSEVTGTVPKAKRAFYTDDTKVYLDPSKTIGKSVTDGETVIVMVGLKCAPSGGATAAGSSRSVVALYAVENSGGGVIPQCVESGV